jgi:hypothetical protein
MSHNPTVRDWLSKSREELDAIYSACTNPGVIPTSEMRGTAIVAGSPFSKAIAMLARLFAWQGKVFDIFSEDKTSGVLINKITAFSLTFVVAKVYRGPSWLDKQPTIIIDYSTTSFFCKKVRDEIREIEPGVYLGKVWWGKKRVLDFALTKPAPKRVASRDIAALPR